MKILFVGGGNMAQAILGGLIAQKIPAGNFCVVEPMKETRAAISVLGIDAFPALTIDLIDCDAIVLAVKPQMMKVAISPLAGILASQVVISIAAGISTASLARWLGGSGLAAPYDNVVRTMPNTPALIRAGITGLYAAAGVSASLDGAAFAFAAIPAGDVLLRVDAAGDGDAVVAAAPPLASDFNFLCLRGVTAAESLLEASGLVDA